MTFIYQQAQLVSKEQAVLLQILRRRQQQALA